MIHLRLIPNLFFLLGCLFSNQMSAQIYRPSAGIETRVNALLAKMTLDEKIGQLSLYTTDWGSTGPTIREGYKNDIRSGACGNLFNAHTTGFVRELQKIAVEETRLKIPLLFGFDVIHGYKTIFPIPLGEAASWDLGAIEKSARVAATEASAAGLNWTYAPMVDISRDPRWGRVMEGAGEDPYLGSRIAEARVRGFQGKKLGDSDAVLACVKHFAGYGAPIAGRDYNTVDMSERYFREFYLPPYEAAVKAGAASVMTSFNDYDGVPASGNKFLLDNILRKEWGFEGFAVTDYTSINEMVNHGVVADEKEAGELALNAGVDMDMQGAVYQRFLKKSLEDGKVTQAQIDEAVRRVLRLKFELGLFEDPYKFCNAEREKSTLLSQANQIVALQMARKSIVLLKNDKGVLPLSRRTQNIALIGPLIDNKSELIGNWNGAGNEKDCKSLLEAINIPVFNMLDGKKVPEPRGRIVFAKGCDIEGTDRSGFAEAIRLAEESDVVVVAVGEKAMMSGEAAARADLGLPGVQEELVLELCKTGKPVVVVLMNGRPLAIPRIAENAKAILETWWLGTAAGYAISDVLTGSHNPSGKLPMTFPRAVGQVPIFYNEKNTGRPYDPNSKWTSKYIDEPNSPQWPFGFGLSYTTFSYSEPRVALKSGGDLKSPPDSNAALLTVTVSVTNTGKLPGDEVAQLYVRDLVGSVTRPVKELKGFQKVFLMAGETKELNFTLSEHDLSFYRRDMTFGTEPGEYEIMVGGNSVDLKKVKVRL